MDWPAEDLTPDLQAIALKVRDLADQYQGDSLALLNLLRLLENLHRDIRDGQFQTSLPNNRQALYALLKDIEAKGGWPYIYRMRLQTLLLNLPSDMVQTLLPNSRESGESEDLESERHY